MSKNEKLSHRSKSRQKSTERPRRLSQKAFFVSAHFFAVGAGFSWATDYHQEAAIAMGLAAVAAVMSSEQLRNKFLGNFKK